MKKLLLLSALILSATALNAQTLGITGVIFEKSSENEARPIPFATVYYYDNQNRESLEYVQYTDIWGQYDLGKEVRVKDYWVVVKAPGYITKSKAIGNLPSSNEIPSQFGGVATLNYELTPTPNEKPYSLITYKPKELVARTKSCLEYLYAIPNITTDHSGNLVVKDGRAARILVHGVAPKINSLEELNELPTSKIEAIEYFELNSSYEEYGGVINIILKISGNGQIVENFSSNFTPIELSKYEIK